MGQHLRVSLRTDLLARVTIAVGLAITLLHGVSLLLWHFEPINIKQCVLAVKATFLLLITSAFYAK